MMVLPAQCKHGVMKKFCDDCHPELRSKDMMMTDLKSMTMDIKDMEVLNKKYGHMTMDDIFIRLEEGERAIKTINKMIEISNKEFSAIMALEGYEDIILEYKNQHQKEGVRLSK